MANMTVKEAVRWIYDNTGVRPSVPSVHRWMLKGVRGNSLPFRRVGGVSFICDEDLSRFLEACNSHERPAPQVPAASSPKNASPDLRRSPARRQQIADNNAHLRKKLSMRQGRP